MGCNCGDNEYNIEIENNGSCEPTTPIYNISLGGVGVDGYSPTVEFINQTDSQFQIRVNDINGTVISNAVPKLSFLIDNYVTNSTLSTTLEDYVTLDYLNSNFYDATSIDTFFQNLTNTYLKKDGSNAANPISLNGLAISNTFGNKKITSSSDNLQIAGSAVSITGTNGEVSLYHQPNHSTAASIRMLNKNIYLDTTLGGGKAYYNNNEIATLSDIPAVGNGTITITQDGVVKGTFTTNQSSNTTIDLDASGSTYTAGTGIDITNDTISIDTSVVATQTDIANKLNKDGSNADSNITINGSKFTSGTGYSMVTMSEGGVINNGNFQGYGKYLALQDDYAYPNGSILVGSYSGYNTGVLILGNATIEGQYIEVNTINSGSFKYNNNEVATVNQIPTVNNPTITFTQGGVTKGTITLNQSGDQTIALDAGGGSITNPIELVSTEVLQDEVPTGYKRLKDIIFDGNIYYDTNKKLYGSDIVTMTISSSITSGQNLFGAYVGTGAGVKNFSMYVYFSNSSDCYYRYNEQLIRPTLGTGARTISFGNGSTSGFKTDKTYTAETFETDSVAYIGALPNSSSAKFNGKITGNILVSDRLKYIPVERESDNTIGYWEPNTQTFLEPQGTGTPTTSGYDTGVYTSTRETTLTLGIETTTEETYLAPILTVEQEYTAEGVTTTNTFNIATEPWVIAQGYTSNIGTVTSVNNVQPDANGDVTLSIPSYTASNGIDITSGTISAKVDGTTIDFDNSGNLTVIGGGGSLPSQTGNSGKFLTTDGNDASWANLPEEIFVATYGTTTFADIRTAYNAGKAILAKDASNNVYYLIECTSNTAWFNLINTHTGTSAFSRDLTVNSSGWNSSTNYLQRDNLVTSIDSTSTDTQYPSAKCVYDLINALINRIITLETSINGGNA